MLTSSGSNVTTYVKSSAHADTSKSDREVVLSAQVAGEVAEIHPQLKIGQRVRPQKLDLEKQSDSCPGDLLLRIDPATYQAKVTQGRNHLAEDLAELDRIKQEASNLEQLDTKPSPLTTTIPNGNMKRQCNCANRE